MIERLLLVFPLSETSMKEQSNSKVLEFRIV